MNTVLKYTSLAALISLMVMQSCHRSENTTSQTSAKNIPLVKAQRAVITTMESYTDISGTIQANIFTDIKSPADGIVENLFARENQPAVKGRLIATINPNERVSLIANSQMQIQLLEQKLKAALSGTEDYNELEKELEKAKNDLEYSRKMYQTIPVICSINGIVTRRWLDEGSQVGAREKIITVSDMNSLVIKAEVNEKYFSSITQGKKIPVILNAYPGDTLSGVISLVYPEISVDTRTVRFDVKLINTSKKLLPGMMAQLRIPTDIHEKAIAVPADAVLTNPSNQRFVFIVNNDSVVFKRIVKTGLSAKTQIEIISGLSDNENVVVMGQEMLKDSLKVKIAGNSKKPAE